MTYLKLKPDARPLEASMRALSISLSGGFERSVGEADGVIRRSIDLNFRAGGRPKKWRDIKPASRKRRRVNKTTPPLTDSGQLRGSLTSPGAPFSVYERDPFGVLRGTTRPDARRHDLIRPFAEVLPHEEAQVIDIFVADIRGRCKRIEAGRF